MDGPKECHTELSNSGREGEMSYDIPYMWNLKENQKYMIQMNLLTKQRLTDLENKLMVAGGKG